MPGLEGYAQPTLPPAQLTPAMAAAAWIPLAVVICASRGSSHTPPEIWHSCVHDVPSSARIQSPSKSGGSGCGGGGLSTCGGGGTDGGKKSSHGHSRE